MAWYAYCIVEQQAVQGGIRARRPVPVEGLKGIADAQIFAYPERRFFRSGERIHTHRRSGPKGTIAARSCGQRVL